MRAEFILSKPGLPKVRPINLALIQHSGVSSARRQNGNSLKFWFSDEKGSAIVEFVVLAIPLFIPIIIYLSSFASLSGNEAIARTLARETLRAYVVSDNDHAGREVSAQALTVIAAHLGLTNGEIRTLATRYECSENPCLSANGRIRLTISYQDSQSHRRIEATAQEHISPWM